MNSNSFICLRRNHEWQKIFDLYQIIESTIDQIIYLNTYHNHSYSYWKYYISVMPSMHISPKQKMDKYVLIFFFEIIMYSRYFYSQPISWQFLTLITNCGCFSATHSSNARITLVCLWMIDDGALTRYNRTNT